MSDERLENAYAADRGPDALERQREAARTRHHCCWAPVDGPHAEGCENAPDEPEPAAQDEALW